MINEIWISDDCNACGICEDICPEVFKIKDMACLIEGVDFSDFELEIMEATESCPVIAIDYFI